jgi:hypothetical protein
MMERFLGAKSFGSLKTPLAMGDLDSAQARAAGWLFSHL